MRMIKGTEKILSIMVLSMAITGCASDPKTIAREEASLDRQALFYEREERTYRESGNEVMAEYFNGKARESREKRSEVNYGPIDLIVDFIFNK